MDDEKNPTLEPLPAGESPSAQSMPGEPPEPQADSTLDRIPDTHELLRQAELKAAEHHDAWLRAKAETDNVRRRAQEDIAKASRFAIEKFAGDLIAVRDALESALADSAPSVENLKAGVDLTLKQLITAFDRASVTQINPAGEKFDPHRHQAVSMVDAEAEPNTVIDVFQKGYLIFDRVLRPAMVTVAKAKS